MISYSALQVFTKRDQALRDLAEKIVARFPDQRKPWPRCHEIARAVARLLRLDVQDGRYGYVDHSWCRIAHARSAYCESYVILDPYAVGRLPQVQLASPIIGIEKHEYTPEALRTDIDSKIVDKLTRLGRTVVRGRIARELIRSHVGTEEIGEPQ